MIPQPLIGNFTNNDYENAQNNNHFEIKLAQVEEEHRNAAVGETITLHSAF